MQLWWEYERGGLIQHRVNLRSAWNVVIPPLRRLRVGRVESYWTGEHGNAVRWRSLDHWYYDFRQDYASRELAARELVAQCPRAARLIADRQARLAELNQLAPGGPPG